MLLIESEMFASAKHQNRGPREKDAGAWDSRCGDLRNKKPSGSRSEHQETALLQLRLVQPLLILPP